MRTFLRLRFWPGVCEGSTSMFGQPNRLTRLIVVINTLLILGSVILSGVARLQREQKDLGHEPWLPPSPPLIELYQNLQYLSLPA